MGYISKIDGSYYEGDKQIGDIDVPIRPSKNHIWNSGSWVLDKSKLWSEYKNSVQVELSATDKTVIRISEAISLGLTTITTPDVVTFMQYRKSLRDILSQPQPSIIPTELPVRHPYPANT